MRLFISINVTLFPVANSCGRINAFGRICQAACVCLFNATMIHQAALCRLFLTFTSYIFGKNFLPKDNTALIPRTFWPFNVFLLLNGYSRIRMHLKSMQCCRLASHCESIFISGHVNTKRAQAVLDGKEWRLPVGCNSCPSCEL